LGLSDTRSASLKVIADHIRACSFLIVDGENRQLVEQVLKQEEDRFAETLDTGMQEFERAIRRLENNTIPGEVAFKLYDTYGFPLDLTQDVAREKGLCVDETGFQRAMEEQKQRSRASGQFQQGNSMPAELMATLPPTEFLGYEHRFRRSLPARKVLLCWTARRFMPSLAGRWETLVACVAITPWLR